LVLGLERVEMMVEVMVEVMVEARVEASDWVREMVGVRVMAVASDWVRVVRVVVTEPEPEPP
jgi:hypothetical protein